MKKLSSAVCQSVAVLALGAHPAAASDDPAAGADLDEVVVTARKRNESLQDIPLAITAFSARDIQDAGIVDLGDLAAQTAGMSFNPRASFRVPGRADSVINMRGVAGNSGQASLDHLQPTSVFIDGIYVLGTANSIGLNDLERVEVIKGPQSAFFGRNTFAGAINYITKTPDLNEFASQLDVSIASYEKLNAYVMNSGPLIPGKLAYQVNASLYERGAEWRATDGGKLGEESSEYASLVLYGEPTDSLSFKFRASYQRDDDGPAAYGVIRGRFADSCTGKTVQRYNNAGTAVASFSPRSYVCGTVPAYGFNEPGKTLLSMNTSLQPVALYTARPGAAVQATGQVLTGPQPNAINQFLAGQNASRFLGKKVPNITGFGLIRDQLRVSLNADYDFASGYAVNFLAGWNDMRMNFLRDYDSTDEEYWYSATPKYGADWSVETRITSPQDSRFRWLAGATMYEQDFITSTNGLLIAICNGNCARGPAVLSTPAINGNLAEAWAVYGSVSFDILPNLTVDLEARYIEDERTASDAGVKFVTTFTDVAPRFIVSYRPTDDLTLYAQASRGTLPGFTNGVIGTCSNDSFLVPFTSPLTGQPSTASECAQLQSQLLPKQYQTVTPSQELDALEVGWKQVFAGGRASVNLAAWTYKWNNAPFGAAATIVRDAANPADRDRIPNAIANTVLVQSPGTERLWGLELESSLALTDRWSADLNVSWSESEMLELTDTSMVSLTGFTNLKGLEVRGYPNWMGSVSTTYSAPFVSGWEWFTRWDLTYQGSYWADTVNLARAEGYSLVNGRVGMKRDNLRLELFARNLLDEDTWAAASQRNDFSQPTFNLNGFHGIGVTPQEKRTVGIRMSLTL